MAPGPWLLLLALALPAQLSQPPQDLAAATKCLAMELLRHSQDAAEEPNPSVYVALRLAAEHDLEKEAQYLQRLTDALPPSAGSSAAGGRQKQHSTGRLALHLLALRAACRDMETLRSRKLVTELKFQLHKEKEQIAFQRNGRPVTSYYQYSLGVLALCVHGKRVDTHVIRKLLSAEKHDKFTLGGRFSVDTAAMAGLAFSCLEGSKLSEAQLVPTISLAVQSVRSRILQAQTPGGTFGNIFSSPLAMQLLTATEVSQPPAYPPDLQGLLDSLRQGRFHSLMATSQLLPVLHGRSYLDLSTMECRAEPDTLRLDSSCPGSLAVAPGAETITVQLAVEHPPSPGQLYNRSLQVPSGSSLLHVLEAAVVVAASQDSEPFTFETLSTLQGPWLDAVLGVRGSNAQRSYWQLLRAPDTRLQQGLSDYRPEDGEAIVLKFSQW